MLAHSYKNTRIFSGHLVVRSFLALICRIPPLLIRPYTDHYENNPILCKFQIGKSFAPSKGCFPCSNFIISFLFLLFIASLHYAIPNLHLFLPQHSRTVASLLFMLRNKLGNRAFRGILVHHLACQKDILSPLPSLKDRQCQKIFLEIITPFQKFEAFLTFPSQISMLLLRSLYLSLSSLYKVQFGCCKMDHHHLIISARLNDRISSIPNPPSFLALQACFHDTKWIFCLLLIEMPHRNLLRILSILL